MILLCNVHAVSKTRFNKKYLKEQGLEKWVILVKWFMTRLLGRDHARLTGSPKEFHKIKNTSKYTLHLVRGELEKYNGGGDRYAATCENWYEPISRLHIPKSRNTLYTWTLKIWLKQKLGSVSEYGSNI